MEARLRDMFSSSDKMAETRGANEMRIKRFLVVLGGPAGIRSGARADIVRVIESYTDLPVISMALSGGILHSYYALANALAFILGRAC